MRTAREWVPTGAAQRAIGLVLAPLILALALGRVDLVVLAAPVAIGSAYAMRRRPSLLPEVRIAAPAELIEGDRTGLEVAVTDPDPAGYPIAVIRIPSNTSGGSGSAIDNAGWGRLEHAGRAVGVAVAGRRTTVLRLDAEPRRWGRQVFGPVRVQAIGCDGLLRSAPVEAEPVRSTVFPREESFEADDAMPDAFGLIGVHRSRRYGDDGELAEIRRFVPGDRLRRIDWRTSLRSNELHVVQTLSERDADLAVVLDVLHNAGTADGPAGSTPDPSAASKAPKTSKASHASNASRPSGTADVLDTTVRAAHAISRHYLGRGDRVALVEFGGRGRSLRAGTGPRQQAIAREWLLDVQTGERRYGPSSPPTSRGLVPDRALVVVLTPLLDERSTAMLADLARVRRSVVAIDTLPAGIGPEATGRAGRWTQAAFGLWRLERQNTIDRLLEHGVPVVRWAGTGSLDLVLRGLAGMAASR